MILLAEPFPKSPLGFTFRLLFFVNLLSLPPFLLSFCQCSLPLLRLSVFPSAVLLSHLSFLLSSPSFRHGHHVYLQKLDATLIWRNSSQLKCFRATCSAVCRSYPLPPSTSSPLLCTSRPGVTPGPKLAAAVARSAIVLFYTIILVISSKFLFCC